LDFVDVGVVGSVVAATGLSPLEGCFESRARSQDHRSEVEGVRESWYPAMSGERRCSPSVRRSRRPRATGGQPVLVAYDARVLGHGIADAALKEPDVYIATGGQQFVDLIADN
jgi:hypothetical protein